MTESVVLERVSPDAPLAEIAERAGEPNRSRGFDIVFDRRL